MKKRILSLLLVLLMVMTLVPVSALAADETFIRGDFTYEIENGVACVRKYNGSSSSVTVPSKVDYDGVTYKVRSIHSKAFQDCTTIRKIVLPETLSKLGVSAFANCTSLNSITINSDIQDIYSVDSVFLNVGTNSDYLDVVFGPTVTVIPARIFGSTYSKTTGYYPHVTSVTIPDSVTAIGSSAFSHCYDLKTIRIGNGMKNIGNYAFQESGIQSLVIDGNCTVGKSAFADCYALKNIIINGNCELGYYSFENCTSLQSITLNGVIADKLGTISGQSVSGFKRPFINVGSNSDSLKVVFGSSITSIPKLLFATGSEETDSYYAHVTEVNIPASVKSIGNAAFNGCYDLRIVNYEGSAVDWSIVNVGDNNGSLTSASFKYGSESMFIDVNVGDYCYDAVKWAVNKNITKGTSAITFSPNDRCTRGQVVTFLWRAAGEPKASTAVNFSDVNPSAYYHDAVQWAVENNITKGTGNNRFSPDATCTRGQVVTLMYRAAHSPSVSAGNGFVDVVVGSYCYDAVNWAVSNGITKGTGGNCFSPDAPCTRAQVVTFLYRAQ